MRRPLIGRINIPPVVKVINKCLASLTHGEFLAAYGKLCVQTNLFRKIADSGTHFINEDGFACQMICHYLTFARHNYQLPTADEIQKEIEKLKQSLFDQNLHISRNEPVFNLNSNLIWDEFEFGTELFGRLGPSLEQCISYYTEKSPWIRNLRHFNMSELGKQELTIPRSGKYKIVAYGAGTDENHGAIISACVMLNRSDVLEVIIGQQSQQPKENYFAYDEDDLLIRSGCGGTFVTRKRNQNKGPGTQSEVERTLLVASGGAGSGPRGDHPNREFSNASTTDTAKGNDIIGTTGLPVYPDTNSVGGGYNEGIRMEWKDGIFGQVPEDTKEKFTGGRFERKLMFRGSKQWMYLHGGFGGGGATNVIDNTSVISYGIG